MGKPHYYVDMDGVIARWDPDASEEETHEAGYFSKREPELAALALVRALKDGGSEVTVLSAVYDDGHSKDEKRDWLEMNGLGDISRIFVPYGEDKHAYVPKEEGVLPVLIDDYSKNLRAWERNGYLAIKFFNGINNLPKARVQDGAIRITLDSWDGYSIDKRMSTRQMLTAVTAIAEREAAAA